MSALAAIFFGLVFLFAFASNDLPFLNLPKSVEEAQFEQIFRRWYAPLCRFAFRLTGKSQASEDIVQEVFIQFWDKRNILEIRQSEKAYLFQAVYNRSLNLLSVGKRHPEVPDSAEYLHPVSKEADADLLFSETETAIQNGLRKLPDGCRQIFELSRFEGLSYKEIAALLEISPKTVETQMSKALRILRQVLICYIIQFLHFLF